MDSAQAKAEAAKNEKAMKRRARDARMHAFVVDFQQVRDHGAKKAVQMAREEAVRKANGLPEGEPGKSQALPEEPFFSLAHRGKIVEPPFDLLTLAMLRENSSELGQCIDAMTTNIDSTGHRFISRLRMDDLTTTGPDADNNDADDANSPAIDPSRAALEKEARAEKVRLTNFFAYCTDVSFVEFRRRLRNDLECTGNAYFEVLRNLDGEIQGFNHVPAYQIRLGRLDNEPTLSSMKVAELQVNGEVKIAERKAWRNFRRFAQSRLIHHGRVSTIEGHRVRWFKEFGDPRDFDRESGEESELLTDSQKANELIHLKIYSPRTPYGLPRFVGNLLSIFGDRAAEEINYTTFRNNNIPSMMICVSNGQLTDGTIERIESFTESTIQGSDNWSKFLIVEAESIEDDDGEDSGHVRIDTKPLTQNQHSDALFQNYSENNQDKIRRAMRLPPIFVGRSDDYTRATAESSRRLADEQVFSPERDEFDEMMNRLILPAMGVRFHRFKSNSPNTTDNTQLVKILSGAEKTGGLTPKIARSILEDILGIDLPDFPPGFPADVPFSMTMAEAVKNQADPAEPGQQVTALKALESLGILGGDGEIFDEENDDDLTAVKKLAHLSATVEELWTHRLRSGEEG